MDSPPGIRLENVARFFRESVPGGDAPLSFELIGGGRSNLTYRVQMGERVVALRRPPLGHVLPTAHDMRREYRVLAALAGGEVPVPRPIALCEDPEVNDHPFYVMEYRPGIVLGERIPDGYLTREDERARTSRAMIDTLVALHRVDVDTAGLADFGRPDGYLERQVRRWGKQWQASRTAPLPEIDQLLERLARALPDRSDATLVHGDYRLGNLALDPHDPGRVVAVFDWEMATLGDPLADLGYTLIYWLEPGEEDPGAGIEAASVSARPGFLSRKELVERYAALSGRDVTEIDFYRVLALTKLAVISEGIYKRFQLGKTAGAGFDKVVRAAAPLAARALAIAEASDDPRLRSRPGQS
jgi:aminoglycoside phosphotransferase (APT) family kinase protein